MDNTQTERVIFRVEKYAYDREARHYLALFPDDPASPGRVECVPFYFDGHGTAWFESCCEADIGYVHSKTRIVHKHDPIAEKLLKTVTEYYSHEVPAHFRIVEKMTH